METKTDFIVQLKGLLNTEAGMAYCCDSSDFYKDMLLTYKDGQKQEEIEEAFRKKDWDNYRILVHALKSTSLTIGAELVSEKAKNLEYAAKQGDIAYIEKYHEDLLAEYWKLLKGIEKVLCKPQQKEQGHIAEEAERAHIVVVDDDQMNVRIAEKILKQQFEVTTVRSGQELLDLLEKKLPDLVLLDLHMPVMDGFEVLTRMQENIVFKEVPVIFLTADDDQKAEVRGFKLGALDFIKKPFIADIMMQRVNRILELNRLQKNLQQEVDKQTRKAEGRRQRLERLTLQIMLALAGTIDAKDEYTNGHSTRVAEYSRMIAKRMGKTEQEQQDIYYMGLLHDIGKIGIPDQIINKTTRLSDEEYTTIKAHPLIGADILKNISEFPDIATGARWHHEHYDGSGYPDGLKGEDIPENARIIAVADAYDAMASKRSYRDVLPQDVVRGEIVKGRGTQFDPNITDIMIELIDEDTEYQMHE